MSISTLRLLLIGWLLFGVYPLIAQTPATDVLYQLDGSRRTVRVREVSTTEVFYVEPGAPSVVRKVRKADVWKIVYSDGVTDVLNPPREPTQASAPTTPPRAASPAPVQTAPPRPTPVETPPPAQAAKPVKEPSVRSSIKREGIATTSNVFSAGRNALSIGLDLSNTSTTNKTIQRTVKTNSSTLNISALFQRFTANNVSVGGGLRYGSSTNTNADGNSNSTSLVGLSGQVRRYLPVAQSVAFYGFAGLDLSNLTSKSTFSGRTDVNGTIQQLQLQGGAGMAYVFGSGWSLDLNTTLLGLTVDRYQPKASNSKASADLSLTGAGVASSFSMSITRYF